MAYSMVAYFFSLHWVLPGWDWMARLFQGNMGYPFFSAFLCSFSFLLVSWRAAFQTGFTSHRRRVWYPNSFCFPAGAPRGLACSGGRDWAGLRRCRHLF
ncbi:hypothetical protein B0I37DRAFT_11452 [Chaetomium sp. MPI-CAGE-AT-0009]|nr:hypothetical protein B0I37DRAFT_11452 [Chaetomium sp. MPI-CAGE-AT-0009]